MGFKKSGLTKILCYCAKEPNKEVIIAAGEKIKQGGLIVYPTDTFYGLGGDPQNIKTIERIYEVKGRLKDKPLPIIISSLDQLQEWVIELTPVAKRLIELYWPGPLTIIFNCAFHIHPSLTSHTGKIGIRWPRSFLANALVEVVGSAIISTSANLSGKGGTVNPHELFKDLNGLVDIIIDAGELPPSLGSTIVDSTCDPVKILREGDIPEKEIVNSCKLYISE